LRTRATPLPKAGRKRRKISGFQEFSGSRESEFGVAVMLVGMIVLVMAVLGMAMRAARAAGLGTGAERFIDDGLDGTRAAAAFCVAAEAAIELLGIARQVPSRVNGAADIIVAQDVTGTDDHEVGRPNSDADLSILKALARCKRKNRYLKQFQTCARSRLE
jgi:hypothetical protein